jgi:gluconate 5-dehydrogenase
MAKNVKDLFDLSGKTAIVTGGSRGLGREMAEGLAEAGANLVLCARRDKWLAPTVEEFRKRGFQVEGMLCDVTNEKQVSAVVEKTVEKFGTVDILINNAGISWGAKPEEMTLEKWQMVLDVNLTGAFLFAKAAGKIMLADGGGSIINISSIAGMKSGADGPFYVGYASSKAALFGMTRELAATWGRQNIRVNAIAPGFFHSRLADAVIEQMEGVIEKTNPIPRVGDEGELKGAAVFLASEASSYITGQIIVVDGGGTIV